MKLENMIVNGKKTIHYLKKNGLKPAYYAAKERLEQQKEDAYQYVAPSEAELAKQREKAEDLCRKIQEIQEIQKIQELIRVTEPDADCEKQKVVTFSILVPAYETKQDYLYGLFDSLRLQSYSYWELVLVDASKTDTVRKTLEVYERQYTELAKQIVYVPLQENRGISENTNEGLPYCTGTYICLVDHDDLLTPDALYYMATAIVDSPEMDSRREKTDCPESNSQREKAFCSFLPAMIYSDEDKCNGDGTLFYDHNDKYKFNLDLILSNNYICHLTAIKKELFQKLQERAAFDGAQDYDLVLRVVSELLQKRGQETGEAGTPFTKGLAAYLETQIVHVPRVLYHWRCHNESTAQNTESKRYAYEAGLRAVQDFMNRHGLAAKVSHSLHLGFYTVSYEPDLLSVRSDVAVVGGRLLDSKNKMMPCIYGENEEPLYVGLDKRYSGRMHRFSLLQDVRTVDLRCAKLAPWVKPILDEILREDTSKWLVENRFDAETYEKEVGYPGDWSAVSRQFCEKVRAEGYTIVYDPTMEKKLETNKLETMRECNE